MCVCLLSLWFCHHENKLPCEIVQLKQVRNRSVLKLHYSKYSPLFIVCFLRKYLSIDPLGTYFQYLFQRSKFPFIPLRTRSHSHQFCQDLTILLIFPLISVPSNPLYLKHKAYFVHHLYVLKIPYCQVSASLEELKFIFLLATVQISS